MTLMHITFSTKLYEIREYKTNKSFKSVKVSLNNSVSNFGNVSIQIDQMKKL